MARQAERPDVDKVLAGLKDFQRNTVDYIFRRMYTDPDCTRRFLVADEVGLGKTMVARGVIARAIDHLWDSVDRIDVVYICSNSDIARQNIARLKFKGEEQFALASRITLLPTYMKDLDNNKVNFISFTPTTSFDLKSSLGRGDERALLYHLLDMAGWIDRTVAPLNVLQGDMSRDNFRSIVDKFTITRDIDKKLARSFKETLKRHADADRADGKRNIKLRFRDLCNQFARSRKYIPDEERIARDHLVGELRSRLAETCLAAIEPDIIILDEFQRFKHLLADDNPMSEMAQGLFNYSDHTSAARVVMLSATPYKMYTLAHESEADNHYEDFLRTIRFLQHDDDASAEFESLLSEYRRELFRLADGGGTRLPLIKKKLEQMMRKVMVRTERLGESSDRDGMLKEVQCNGLRVAANDLRSYSALQQIGGALGTEDSIEYWKSAPYILNFMEGYKFKTEFKEAIDSAATCSAISSAINGFKSVLFPWEEFEAYEAVDPGNARLRSLLGDTVDAGAWQLLWIPPSLPYYRLEGPFAQPSLEGFTKRLIFSSWRIVPKAIATMVSYEAERRMIRSHEESRENSPEARKRRRPLLQFAKSDGRLTGMPVLGLLYPCAVLARDCDPLLLARDLMGQKDEIPTRDELLSAAIHRIAPLLEEISKSSEKDGPEDNDWYWAAPILLDRADDRDGLRSWLDQVSLAASWSGETPAAEGEEESRWDEHVDQVRELIAGRVSLGRQPDDLAQVLARMAIAGPGTSSLRALSRVTGGGEATSQIELRNSAARAAWGFRILFNLPEAMAMIRGLNREEPYWRRALDYCTDGGLQAVLDEYVHYTREAIGLFDRIPSETAGELAKTMLSALTLRTATIGVDDIKCDAETDRIDIDLRRMRVHFALRFGDEQSDDEKSGNRKEQVRDAFNSPFWPFVIASTSVGQEGLDFHPYCHAIIHWNLPSNPVDMEQREGRVHRYKGHAVRKNLAKAHGFNLLRNGNRSADPWESMFAAARRGRPEGSSDLIPYWIYPVDGGAKIERHIPALPLSRDHERAASVRHALTVYRMVFGQNRQEDLLAYLVDRLPTAEIERVVDELKIDLRPSK